MDYDGWVRYRLYPESTTTTPKLHILRMLRYVHIYSLIKIGNQTLLGQT